MFQHIKRLLKDSVIYGLGRYLSSIVSLFLVPLYTRLLTPEQFGAADLLSTLSSTLSIFAVLGLDAGMALLYYREEVTSERVKIASTALYIRLALALAIALGGIASATWLAPALFHRDHLASLMQWSFCAFPFLILQGFALDYMRLRLQPWHFGVVSVLGVLVSTGCGLFFIAGLRLGVLGLILANGLYAAVLGVIGTWVVRDGLRLAFSWPHARKMLAYGLPLLPASVATLLVSYSDRYFMSQYQDLAQLGVYAIAQKLAAMMTLVTASFQMAWVPFAFSLEREANSRDIYAKALLGYLLLTTSLALLLGLFAPEILTAFTTRHYAAASSIAAMLLFVPVFTGLSSIVSLGVTLASKTSLISMATGISAMLSLSLSALLIPRWGMAGAALSCLVSQAAAPVALYLASQRHYFIPYNVPKAVGILGAGAGALALGTILAPLQPTWGLAIKLGSLGAFGMALALLRVLGPSELRALAGFVRRQRDSFLQPIGKS